MFVKIHNMDMSVIDIDGWIKRRRNENGMSPEFAMEVLSKTNHYGNIKTVLNCIEKLPLEEQIKYKEFVVSAVCYRETSKDTFDRLLKLAVDGGYENYFAENNNIGIKSIIYKKDDCKVFLIGHMEEFSTDMKMYDSLAIDSRTLWEKGGGALEFSASGLPKRVSFEEWSEYSFSNSCFEGVKELNLGGYSESAKFENIEIMPERVVIDNINDVRFSHCDFSKIKKAKISCERLVLRDCSGFEGFKYFEVNNLFCDYKVDLSAIEKLKVKKGGSLIFVYGGKLPKYLDLSEAGLVGLGEIKDFSNVEEIKFMNKEQKEKVCNGRALSKDMENKIVYVTQDFGATYVRDNANSM